MANLTNIRPIGGMESYSVATEQTESGYRAVLIQTESQALLVTIRERDTETEADLDTYALTISMMLGQSNGRANP